MWLSISWSWRVLFFSWLRFFVIPHSKFVPLRSLCVNFYSCSPPKQSTCIKTGEHCNITALYHCIKHHGCIKPQGKKNFWEHSVSVSWSLLTFLLAKLHLFVAFIPGRCFWSWVFKSGSANSCSLWWPFCNIFLLSSLSMDKSQNYVSFSLLLT